MALWHIYKRGSGKHQAEQRLRGIAFRSSQERAEIEVLFQPLEFDVADRCISEISGVLLSRGTTLPGDIRTQDRHPLQPTRCATHN